MLDAHVGPKYPGAQVQLKELTPSVHDPPFKHGFGEHSLILVAQIGPVNPGRQVHTPFMHEPPFKHGLGSQSSSMFSHNIPLYSGRHTQVTLVRFPPF